MTWNDLIIFIENGTHCVLQKKIVIFISCFKCNQFLFPNVIIIKYKVDVLLVCLFFHCEIRTHLTNLLIMYKIIDSIVPIIPINWDVLAWKKFVARSKSI